MTLFIFYYVVLYIIYSSTLFRSLLIFSLLFSLFHAYLFAEYGPVDSTELRIY